MMNKGRVTSNACASNNVHRRPNHVTWDSVLPIPKPSGFISALLVGALAISCYVNSLDGHFVFDDSEAIVNNEDLRPETPIWNLLENDFWGTRLSHNNSHKSYRPLTVLSFRWNYWLAGGLRPAGFHCTNILFHAAVSVISLPLFNCLFGGNCAKAALLTSILFAVHPVHAEAVAGVVGRADLLCTLLYFSSFLCYAGSIDGRRNTPAAMLGLVASMILAVAAMFSKEQGITVIGLCSAYDVVVKSRIHPASVLRTAWRARDKGDGCDAHHQGGGLVARHAMLLATGLLLLALRLRLMASGPPTFQRVDNPASFADSVVTRSLTYNYVYALNAWLLLCPEWLCFDWSMGCVPLLEDVGDSRGVVVILLWLVLGGLVHRSLTSDNSRTHRSLTMSLALLLVPFLPATNLFFRVGFVIAERVLYLPSSGLCMLVVLGFRQLSTLNLSRTLLRLLYGCLVAVFVARAAQRSSEWRTEGSLFRSGLAVCPLNAKVHYNVAKNAADAGDRSLAVERYRRALGLEPDYDQAMNNLANILKDVGRLDEAESLLRRAVTVRPDFAAAWMNLGIVLSGLRRHDEAELCYRTALRHRRKYPDCYYNLGNLYLDRQQYGNAYKAWRNATLQKPTHVVAWSNMIIMLDNIGEASQAESVAHEALALLPNEASLHFNLANMLGKASRFAEAEKHFAQAIQLDRNNPMYFTNLGVLYHRWKKFDKAEGLYRRALEINPKLQSAVDNLKLLYKNLGGPMDARTNPLARGKCHEQSSSTKKFGILTSAKTELALLRKNLLIKQYEAQEIREEAIHAVELQAKIYKKNHIDELHEVELKIKQAQLKLLQIDIKEHEDNTKCIL